MAHGAVNTVFHNGSTMIYTGDMRVGEKGCVSGSLTEVVDIDDDTKFGYVSPVRCVYAASDKRARGCRATLERVPGSLPTFIYADDRGTRMTVTLSKRVGA